MNGGVLLDRIVSTKEAWSAALTGGSIPESLQSDGSDDSDKSDGLRSIPAMVARFEAAETEFDRILREVRDEGRWDDTFVDALCEPPETFTYGGMFTHVLTFNPADFTRYPDIVVVRPQEIARVP